MSIADYVLDDSIVVVGRGDGWSIWADPDHNRWRFNVSAGSVDRSAAVEGKPGRKTAREGHYSLWCWAYDHPELLRPIEEMRAFIFERWPA